MHQGFLPVHSISEISPMPLACIARSRPEVITTFLPSARCFFILLTSAASYRADSVSSTGRSASVFPSGVVRDELGVHPRSLKILHDAMLAETEDPEGTGRGGGRARSAHLRENRHGPGQERARPVDRLALLVRLVCAL